MPKCQDWLIHALVKLDLASGPFSDMAYNAFQSLDTERGKDSMNVEFVAGNWGTSWENYKILLPDWFLSDTLPPQTENVALLAHETIHQTQTRSQRLSTWGEAQAFIFQALVREEMGMGPDPILYKIVNDAFDWASPLFTTRDRDRLRRVKSTIVNAYPLTKIHRWHFPNPIYLLEPLLPWEFIDRCGL